MREVHLLRACHDVIMVGVGTVLSDDPQLNVRLPGLEDRSPVRVVLDSGLRLPLASKLVMTARDIPVWVVGSEEASIETEAQLRIAGIEVMRVGRASDGHLDLGAALRLLALRGVTRVFSEGGPQVGEALAAAGLADMIIVSTADHALDAPGIAALRPGFAQALGDPARYALQETARHGTDVFATYRRMA